MPRPRKKKKKFKLKSLKILKDGYKHWLILGGWCLFVLLLVGYFYLVSLKEHTNISRSVSGEPTLLLNKSRAAWLEVDYGNGKKRIFTADFSEQFSLLAVLDPAIKEGKLKLVTKKGTIESIDGVKGRWKIYRNSKYSGTNLDKLLIKAGDKYLFRREK